MQVDGKCALGWWDEGIGKTHVHPKLNPERIKQVSLLKMLGMRERKSLVLSHHLSETLFINGKIRWLKGMWQGKQGRKNCGTHQEGGSLCRTSQMCFVLGGIQWQRERKWFHVLIFKQASDWRRQEREKGPALEGRSEHWGDLEIV